jgi:hypothetical protein
VAGVLALGLAAFGGDRAVAAVERVSEEVEDVLRIPSATMRAIGSWW